ncbi:sterol desaturase family protein [Haliangium ochraceum]|uniref:Fatty acid hydroxylase n=1 Tax=Haliangium ochraceum (strain DSM 14365 / JCM 11303 / SMP-2) TaxID=502025 RepID=D0LLF8_HALO1|nr:sterol desaturase family protein [Haliangium ochraceum]ACY13175.1 fatty acid hydroxylase [Haliangium ochraceum DSM 14365]
MDPELPNVIQLAVPFFVLLIAAEMVLWKRRGNVVYETRDATTSLLMGVGNLVAGLLTGGLVVLIYFAVYRHRVFDLGYEWWMFVLVLVVRDFVFYWGHRLSHTCRWFWANHVVHHSSQHYNLTTALRQPWTSGISLLYVLGIPVIWLGVPPALYFFAGGVNLVYQFWIHTEAVGRLGPLEWVLNTPSHHRAHHATNPRYLDSNYAGMLIIWDRIFGTFVPEDPADPPRYGLVKNLHSFNPVRVAFHEYASIVGDLRRARSLSEIGGYVLGPPGWSPDGSRQTSAQIQDAWRRRARAQSEAQTAAQTAAQVDESAIQGAK